MHRLTKMNLTFPIGQIGIYSFALFAPLSIAFSQISISITLLGWIMLIFQSRSFQWRKTPLDIPILIYVFIQFIAALFSQDMLIGIRVWLNTDWFILFFYAVVHLIDDEKQYKKIIILLALSGSVSAIYGIVQHFDGIDYLRGMRSLIEYGSFYRAIGFFDLPLTYGGVQLTLFLFLLPFYFVKQRFINRKIVLIIIILLLLSIFASYARSAWLGLGAVFIILLFFLDKKYMFSLIGAAVLGLILIYFIHPDLLFQKGLFSMFDMSETAHYNNRVRMHLWQTAIKMISDNWLVGIGYSHFTEIENLYKVPFDYRGLGSPHNIFLKIMCHSGILGGLAFINLWYQFFKSHYTHLKPDFFKNLNLYRAGSLGSFFAIFALLIGGLTQEYYYDHENAELWWFIVALGISGFQNVRAQREV